MKRIMTVILLTLAVAGAALAQETKPKPADALPTADQIIEKYVQAVGGKAAIEKINSQVAKGTLEIPAAGLTGSVEIYKKGPNKLVTIASIAGLGEIKEGYDGTTAWSANPMTGLRDKAGVELANAKLEAELHRDIKLKQLYPTMVVKGKDKVGDKDVYIVEATPKEGSVEKWYFDAQTGLLLRTDSTQESPEGSVPVEVYIDEYKEFDGVKMPVSTRISTPTYVITVKTPDVKNNVPVEDAKFTKPAAK
jgi:hypothetical protein